MKCRAGAKFNDSKWTRSVLEQLTRQFAVSVFNSNSILNWLNIDLIVNEGAKRMTWFDSDHGVLLRACCQ